ncbi:MAG TPA: MCE family protein [Algoriphagus sp.]|jgi:phospholipid/cholesterol/gamma-HCH transport system substrate-binding protein|uniref:MlaD family protein n=1 Tax=unclassified Algoriphagus TaxID=2641541 RepID=UPI000C44766C|nr:MULTISPECIES: MlaD family protein [unclassified Algoriphagus]MAL15941.1 ABC transporter permease [Algoriphagus sp.]MAN86715.1 ABC transporter permease [Algoriphagus sp.]HAH38859.1 MCE family protein [Algoriphagus sp.]HAS59414.1 MCE family protein [Algoriphagus sp.]HAZ23501.1 MCE family protein [Algoriphagus sp.]|tara:strand:- start:50 stop:1024 length:975 start_codon:yes stop_codon:yes gene_type:complete
MRGENKRSVIVGIFVFLGIAILVAGVLTLGGQQKKFVKAIHLKAVFDDIGGLQTGNNIWFSGVKIGTVRKINFYGDSQVEIEMNVEKSVAEFIRKDSKATISSDGLIGNKIIVIYGGTTLAPPVEDGDRLEAVMPLDTDKMMETLQENNKNLVDITNDLKLLTGKLANGEGIVGAVMTDSVLADNFRSILNNLNRASINSNKMLTDLTKFSSKLNAEGSLFNDLATDTTMVTDLKATLESFRSSANNTEALTAKLNEISAKLDDPNNSLGLLLNDPEFAQTLKSTLENTDSATYNLNRGLEALEYTWPFRKGFKRKAKAEEEGN